MTPGLRARFDEGGQAKACPPLYPVSCGFSSSGGQVMLSELC